MSGNAGPYKAAGAGQPRLKDRYLILEGPDLERYAQTTARLILSARLNKWYPDPFGCSDRVRFLAPSLRRDPGAAVALDRRTGLPQLKDVLTVQVDRRIAPDFIAQQEARIAAGRSITPKVQAKLEYYRDLVKVSIPPLHSLEVRLRRVYPGRDMAAFQVVFDRFDTADGVFVRYTLLLEQTDNVWGSSLLERSGDYTRQTSDFREKMEKFAQDESEIMFLLLSRQQDLRIEEITRGCIGPVWSPWTPAPPGWSAEDPEAFVLHCPLDQASIAIEADCDNDPFRTLYRQFLSDVSRSVVDQAANELGYRVRKERKFACTASVEALLKRRLDEARTRNAVYAI